MGKIGQQNVFENILARKKAFQDCKNTKLKSGKIGIFPKGLVYGFGQAKYISPDTLRLY